MKVSTEDWVIKFLKRFARNNSSSPSGLWWKVPSSTSREKESNPLEVIKWIKDNILAGG